MTKDTPSFIGGRTKKIKNILSTEKIVLVLNNKNTKILYQNMIYHAFIFRTLVLTNHPSTESDLLFIETFKYL